MDCDSTFRQVVQLVKLYNLNFCLEESPFSAKIYLKKSFVKNMSGTPLKSPTTDNNNWLVDKIIQLEKSVNYLQHELEESVEECRKVYMIKNQLEDMEMDYQSNLTKDVLARNEMLVNAKKNE